MSKEATMAEEEVPKNFYVVENDHDADEDQSLFNGASTLCSTHGASTTDPDSSLYIDNESRDEVREIQLLAKKETRSIRIWRGVVAALILGAGALVSWGTYYYLDRQLTDKTEDKFNLFANSIEDASLVHFEDLAKACRSLALAITTQAIARNWTWPFVTMEGWEVNAGEARTRGLIEMIAYLPVLKTDDEIAQFNVHAMEHKNWQAESVAAYRELHPEMRNVSFPESESTFVYNFNFVTPWVRTPATIVGPFPVVPIWLLSPPSQSGYNFMLSNWYRPGYLLDAAIISKGLAMGELVPALGAQMDGALGEAAHLKFHTDLHGDKFNSDVDVKDQAHVPIYYPVFTKLDKYNEQAEVRGFLTAAIGFDAFLVDILPDGIRGIRVVVANSCNDTFTYELDGNEATYLGPGDHSDKKYSHLQREILFANKMYDNVDLALNTGGHCIYRYLVTPTALYEQDNESSIPLIFTIIVGSIFVLMAASFFVYDMNVQKRNNKMVNTAARSNAIVSSIFPSTIRDRLLDEEADNISTGGLLLKPTKSHIKSFLNKSVGAETEDDENDEMFLVSKPIADLFTETTVMFADISGFTAWSSVREPSQVFTLLETVYRSFDSIARRRGVFKVETVGDCYVAVCGLPEPRKDHPFVMARFARDCLGKMSELSRKLEVVLGPDTGDLGMRIGIHSGPVTAGVLRGERSRFQLFGDTMNTASRMESTGQVNRIQVSEETAKLIIKAGKNHWVYARQGTVAAKGKGMLSTYWLSRYGDLEEDQASSGHWQALPPLGSRPESGPVSDRLGRLIDWNCEVMLKLLKQIVHRRSFFGVVPAGNREDYEAKLSKTLAGREDATLLDEVQEVIRLPLDKTNDHFADDRTLNDDVSPTVMDELTDFVTSIAALYNNNPFHSFEHASHVTMSVVKLLSRIVAPSEVDLQYEQSHQKEDVSSLHDHTYGITSDPLTQFSCVLSALIHDCDHPGVPNATLVKEGQQLAVYYKGKSVAEQNSVDLAWNLLMDDKYKNLRSTIYVSESELIRFRQLIVNSVMATDIVDKELKALRNIRWETAFNMEMPQTGNEQENVNRKATIVIEHLIQASDVAHTMQHWHIYRKWNERFFRECYKAFCDGRAETDPSTGWYKGEIGFFDFYIIPLARKLKECGVFGVSSDEYLNYALKNRKEWEERGQEIVALMMEKINSEKTTTEHSSGSDSPHEQQDVPMLETIEENSSSKPALPNQEEDSLERNESLGRNGSLVLDMSTDVEKWSDENDHGGA